jgi:uncharacterized cupin superfamily protein
VRTFNVLGAATEADPQAPAGYRARMARFGPRLGARELGASVYDLPPGQAHCPYHWEEGDEEWLVVLAGHPSVRHPEGEQRLEPGDTVCFPAGPQGAHKVFNAGDEDARVLMLSTRHLPSVAVFPDSDKVSIESGTEREQLNVRRADAVGYYEGEL